jgi:hypothetical protein
VRERVTSGDGIFDVILWSVQLSQSPCIIPCITSSQETPVCSAPEALASRNSIISTTDIWAFKSLNFEALI